MRLRSQGEGKKMNFKNTVILASFILGLVVFGVFAQAGSSTPRVYGDIVVNGSFGQGKVDFKIDPIDQNGSLTIKTDNGSQKIDVKYVYVDGKHAWFAGKCVQDSQDMKGRWLFVVIHDGGKPGRLVDHMWWQWLDDSDNAEQQAKAKVDNLDLPANNKSVEDGEIVIN